MKLIKSVLIFVVVAAGIFVAINWNSLVRQRAADNWAAADLLDVDSVCTAIRTAWAGQPAWDLDTYTWLSNDIAQSRSMALFSEEGYATVRNTLRETSVNKAVDAYLNAIHCREGKFSHDALMKHYRGVTEVRDLENVGGDPRIAGAESLQRLYTQIRAFVTDSHILHPEFDTRADSWTSFDAARNAVISTAAGYRAHKLFGEMSSVPGFVDGLSEPKLTHTVDPQRTAYYATLSRQILDYYRTLDSNRGNYSRFIAVYNRYANESEVNLGELATFKVNFQPAEE